MVNEVVLLTVSLSLPKYILSNRWKSLIQLHHLQILPRQQVFQILKSTNVLSIQFSFMENPFMVRTVWYFSFCHSGNFNSLSSEWHWNSQLDIYSLHSGMVMALTEVAAERRLQLDRLFLSYRILLFYWFMSLSPVHLIELVSLLNGVNPHNHTTVFPPESVAIKQRIFVNHTRAPPKTTTICFLINHQLSSLYVNILEDDKWSIFNLCPSEPEWRHIKIIGHTEI